MNISITNRVFYACILMIFLLSSVVQVGAINTVSTGFILDATAKEIDAHNICKLTKSDAGVGYFTPTKTENEWTTFIDKHPTDVSLASCSCGMGEYSISLDTSISLPLIGGENRILDTQQVFTDDILIFGAENTTTNSQSLYIYNNNGTSWVFGQRIPIVSGDVLTSIIIDNGRILYGTHTTANELGGVNVLKITGGVWVQSQIIRNPNTSISNTFGFDLQSMGGDIVVSSPEIAINSYSELKKYYYDFYYTGSQYVYKNTFAYSYHLAGKGNLKMVYEDDNSITRYEYVSGAWLSRGGGVYSYGSRPRIAFLNEDYMVLQLSQASYGPTAFWMQVYKRNATGSFSLHYRSGPTYSLGFGSNIDIKGDKLAFSGVLYSISGTAGINHERGMNTGGPLFSDNYYSNKGNLGINIYKNECVPKRTTHGLVCVTNSSTTESYSPPTLGSTAYYNGLGIKQGGFNTTSYNNYLSIQNRAIPAGNYKVTSIDPELPIVAGEYESPCFHVSNDNQVWQNISLSSGASFEPESCHYRVKFSSFTPQYSHSKSPELNKWYLMKYTYSTGIYFYWEHTGYDMDATNKSNVTYSYTTTYGGPVTTSNHGVVSEIQKYCY